jgi:hypothetical protein
VKDTFIGITPLVGVPVNEAVGTIALVEILINVAELVNIVPVAF